MSKTYLPYDPDQQLLLPAALQEWLPDDHLAYFISDVVDQLDLSEITARYERESRGGPPGFAFPSNVAIRRSNRSITACCSKTTACCWAMMAMRTSRLAAVRSSSASTLIE